MRYENRLLLMSLAIAGLALGRCEASAADRDQEANQDITVTCTNTVAYDVGACQILANARCDGEGTVERRTVQHVSSSQQALPKRSPIQVPRRLSDSGDRVSYALVWRWYVVDS
jgi:hypothetical protein